MKGRVFVVGDNIDTDQIIPAKHLMLSTQDPEERKLYGRYAMSGLPDTYGTFTPDYAIIVAGKNFGCGSSREHAPLALQMAGVQAIVAASYARIFYRNTIDGAFLTPFESSEKLDFATGDEAEIQKGSIANVRTGKRFLLRPLGDASGIIEAGGIFAYARKLGLIKCSESR
jgi:3-isopropylmalate/(R)-2-methylmalate dehydratase small subunit